MKCTILNREFQHPSDGWYQIEPKGQHPNRAAGIVQVIDDEAATAIVNRFNADADANKLRHGSEMLIDHEHFSDQSDQETRAYGWLTKLANRADGIYGQIRWTATGKPAVDGGDYRFFSTEYSPKDLQVVNSSKKTKFVRPLRLDGLTLTNMHNNLGQRPITNRQGADSRLPVAPADGVGPDCNIELTPNGQATLTCPQCSKNFAVAGAPAANQQQPSQVTNKMKNIATKLGLAAEASEDSILAEVTKLQNRVSASEPLVEENKTLKNRIAEFDGEQADSLLALHGVKDAKIINRLKPVLIGLKNREDRVATLVDLGYKVLTDGQGKPSTGRVINRNNAGQQSAGSAAAAEPITAAALNDEVRKVMNRDGSKFETAFNVLKREKPELFAAPETEQE